RPPRPPLRLFLQPFEDGEDLAAAGGGRKLRGARFAGLSDTDFAGVLSQFVDAEGGLADPFPFGHGDVEGLGLGGGSEVAGAVGADLALDFDAPLAVRLVDDGDFLDVFRPAFVAIDFQLDDLPDAFEILQIFLDGGAFVFAGGYGVGEDQEKCEAGGQ